MKSVNAVCQRSCNFSHVIDSKHQAGTVSAQVVPEVFQLHWTANLGTEHQFSCFDEIVRRVILGCPDIGFAQKIAFRSMIDCPTIWLLALIAHAYLRNRPAKLRDL